jgi:site-specific DNA recombinase
VKVFELSQALTSKWLAADIAEKRLLLEIICLNWTLDGVTLVPQMRKPFDLLVEGLLVSSSRGDMI